MTALSTPADVEAVADQLTAAADAIHQRIVQDIAARLGAPVPEPDQMAMRQLLDDEMVLRQRANGMYADAAAYTVKALAQPQAQVVRLTADAAEKIRTITRIGDAIALSAALATVAGAAVTGQAPAVIAALEKLRRTVKTVRSHG